MKHCSTSIAWSTIALAATASAPAPAMIDNPAQCLCIWQQAEAKTKAKDAQAAIALWERFTQINPHVGAAWAKLARAYYDAKNYERSIFGHERALELQAGYPWASAYDIARCHALLGHKEQALEWLEKSLKMGFRSLDRVRADEDLKSLRDDERYRKLAAVEDTSKLSRDEGWRIDLELLAREIKRVHYRPFRKISEADFDAHVNRLRDEIPHLTDDQVRVRFMNRGLSLTCAGTKAATTS
jgi:tetratricopeptide (TPR) repeat protein